MDTRNAVLERRSVRAFLDRPVDKDLLVEAIRDAGRAPSGGNLQPWHTIVLTGDALAEVTSAIQQRVSAGQVPGELEYEIYPQGLNSPYRERRYRNGEQLYEALQIPREDKPARLAQFANNFSFFGAPVGIFCYVDRQMGSAQWSDLGMFLQTLMLLLHDKGVASCAQEAWSIYHSEVAAVLNPSSDHVLFCGVSVGYEDTEHPVNSLRTERAPLTEIADFRGWS